MKNFKDIRKTLGEEYGAGEWGTDELTNKYKAMTPGQNPVTEAKWKVTFVHNHPEGEKKHDYVVSAPHQNAADKKAIEAHRQQHPKGDFEMWNSEELHEAGLKDACWKGYEAIGMKMKGGRKVPNCVPKEDTTTIEKPVAEESDDKNLRITKHERLAIEAEKRGDKRAQQFHLDKVNKLKTESVNESVDEAASSFSHAANLATKHADSDDSAHGADLGGRSIAGHSSIQKHKAAYDAHLKAAKHHSGDPTLAKEHSSMASYHRDHLIQLGAMDGKPSWEMNESKEEEKMQKHLVTVTVSDPHHSMQTKRKEKIMKRVKVSAVDPKDAIKKAESHYKKHGFKVHDSLHHSVVKESLDSDEIIDGYDAEEDAEELSMAKAQLREIVDMAQDLIDSMEDSDELEAWMASKITSANKDIDDVYSSIAYGDDDSEEDQGSKADSMDEAADLAEADSGPANFLGDESDKPEYAKHMRNKFGVSSKFHGRTKISFHGPTSSVRRALEFHHGSFDAAARNHKKLYPKAYLKKSL